MEKSYKPSNQVNQYRPLNVCPPYYDWYNYYHIHYPYMYRPWNHECDNLSSNPYFTSELNRKNLQERNTFIRDRMNKSPIPESVRLLPPIAHNQSIQPEDTILPRNRMKVNYRTSPYPENKKYNGHRQRSMPIQSQAVGRVNSESNVIETTSPSYDRNEKMLWTTIWSRLSEEDQLQYVRYETRQKLQIMFPDLDESDK